MSVSLSFFAKYDDVVNALEKMEFDFNNVTDDSLEEIGQETTKKMKAEAPVGTGKLKSEIDYKLEKSGSSRKVTIKSSAENADGEEYAFYVEKGRPAGKAPPISSIIAWASAKGLSTAVAQKIAMNIKMGNSNANRPNPFVERTFKEIVGSVEDIFNKGLKKLVKDF